MANGDFPRQNGGDGLIGLLNRHGVVLLALLLLVAMPMLLDTFRLSLMAKSASCSSGDTAVS